MTRFQKPPTSTSESAQSNSKLELLKARVEERKRKFRRQSSALLQRASGLGEEIENYHDENKFLKEHLKDVQIELADTRNKLLKQQAKLSTFMNIGDNTKSNEEIQLTPPEFGSLIEILQRRINDLHDEKSKLATMNALTIQKLQREIESSKNDENETNEPTKVRGSAIQELQHQISTLQSSISSLENCKEMGEFQNHIGSAKDDVAVLDDIINSLEADPDADVSDSTKVTAESQPKAPHDEPPEQERLATMRADEHAELRHELKNEISMLRNELAVFNKTFHPENQSSVLDMVAEDTPSLKKGYLNSEAWKEEIPLLKRDIGQVVSLLRGTQIPRSIFSSSHTESPVESKPAPIDNDEENEPARIPDIDADTRPPVIQIGSSAASLLANNDYSSVSSSRSRVSKLKVENETQLLSRIEKSDEFNDDEVSLLRVFLADKDIQDVDDNSTIMSSSTSFTAASKRSSAAAMQKAFLEAVNAKKQRKSFFGFFD